MTPNSANPSELVDTSGLGNNGTIGNGASLTTDVGSGAPASVKSALVFGKNDTAMVNNVKLLNSLGARFTIAAWVKPSSFTPPWLPIVSTRGPSAVGDEPFNLSLNTQIPSVYFNGLGGQGWYNTESKPDASALVAGRWINVAVTFDRGGGTFYVNGNVVSTFTTLGAVVPNGQDLLNIGTEWFPQGEEWFDGLIRNLQIFPVALTGLQIEAAMNGTLPTVPATASDFPPFGPPPSAPSELQAPANDVTPFAVGLSWNAVQPASGTSTMVCRFFSSGSRSCPMTPWMRWA